MNEKQGRNLTQKQRELVKKLESIRNSREGVSQQTKKVTKRNQPTASQRRNKETLQRQPSSTAASNRMNKPVRQDQLARPANRSHARSKPMTKKMNNQRNEKPHYVEQLSSGKKLSQALILSEVLGKPVALRKR